MKLKSNLLILLASGALALPVGAQVPSGPGAAAAATSPAAVTTTAEASPAAPAKDRFGGFVTAVDATAKTVTVDNKTKGTRTFQMTDTTQATDATEKAVTLADVKVGDRIHGTYETGADGKLNLLKVKVGVPAKTKSKEAKEKK